ncbi:hypothetical protein [Actinopolymorpha rutila]|uniref:Uncharacterized protein n=1 Tax=Actinopolymorpha rutila TaxID=446787 RepID=A0A852ZI00_9ACTN|nr:hypothetical protein [Actinopolymorpha rutila]NYH92697.1 hypothetical protein [Actinopolymorpha rutila]
MTTTPDSDPRQELQQVEDDLARLRGELDEVRALGGTRFDPPNDAGDVAAELTAEEEQQAIIATLEKRRDDLRRKLGLAEGS